MFLFCMDMQQFVSMLHFSNTCLHHRCSSDVSPTRLWPFKSSWKCLILPWYSYTGGSEKMVGRQNSLAFMQFGEERLTEDRTALEVYHKQCLHLWHSSLSAVHIKLTQICRCVTPAFILWCKFYNWHGLGYEGHQPTDTAWQSVSGIQSVDWHSSLEVLGWVLRERERGRERKKGRERGGRGRDREREGEKGRERGGEREWINFIEQG